MDNGSPCFACKKEVLSRTVKYGIYLGTCLKPKEVLKRIKELATRRGYCFDTVSCIINFHERTLDFDDDQDGYNYIFYDGLE